MDSDINISESELEALLQEVKGELEKAYEISKEKLIKAEGEESSSPILDDSSADKPVLFGGEAGGESKKPVPAPVPPTPSPAAPVAPAPVAPITPELEVQVTPETLQAEYSQLSPEELDMHLQAALAAKDAKGKVPVPGAPPAPTMKNEELPVEESKGDKKEESKEETKGVPVTKSENHTKTKIEELEKVIRSQAEDIVNLTKSIQMVLEQPLRKAITSAREAGGTSTATKNSFTRADVDALISKNAGKLNKSEREIVLSFYDGKSPASSLEAIIEKLVTNK